MPNTNPPTTSIEALEDKIKRAERVKDVDIRFFFGVTKVSHLDELRALHIEEKYTETKARCCGAKVFFDHSTGDQGADKETIEQAFKLCAELDIPLVAHCEDSEINAEAANLIRESNLKNVEGDVSLHSLTRPSASEEKAVNVAINFAQKYGTHLHVAHLSTVQGLQSIRAAKKGGFSVTCEVTPHHLFLSLVDYETLGILGKMNPPVRTADNCGALWEGISDGTIDCISTDHAPHTLEEKESHSPLDAPSGVPGTETMLPLLLTVASGGWPAPKTSRPEGLKFSYDDITRLCFENPNRIFSLGKSKDETITINPDEEWIIHGKDLHSKCGWTPYEGWKVKGRVRQV
jgi:dihydroorotase